MRDRRFEWKDVFALLCIGAAMTVLPVSDLTGGEVGPAGPGSPPGKEDAPDLSAFSPSASSPPVTIDISRYFGQIVKLTPDGRFLLGQVDFNLVVIETATRKVVMRAGDRTFDPLKSVISPDGKHVAAISDHTFGMSLVLFDVQRGTKLWEEKMDPTKTAFKPRALAFTADSSRLIVLGDPELRSYRVDTGKEVAKLRLKPEASSSGRYSIAVSPDGKRVALSSHEFWNPGLRTPPLILLDIPSGKVSTVFNLGVVTSVAFSPDGKWFAALGYPPLAPSEKRHAVVRLWDSINRSKDLAGSGAQGSVCFSPDSKIVAAGVGWQECREPRGTVSFPDGQVTAWDTVTGKQVFCGGTKEVPLSLVGFSADSRLLGATLRIGKVTGTGRTVISTTLHDGRGGGETIGGERVFEFRECFLTIGELGPLAPREPASIPKKEDMPKKESVPKKEIRSLPSPRPEMTPEERAASRVKLGQTYVVNGMVDKGRQILEQVVRDYPTAKAAQNAREILKSLGDPRRKGE